jgi:peroxiredoxin
LVTSLAPAAAAAGGVAVGAPAPDFTLPDQSGASVSLKAQAGKVVVLEWVNPDCPFVKRHAAAGTMRELATRYAARGVVWLGVNSTSYMSAEDSAKYRAASSLPYPILVDQAGTVGKLYGARTTPHLFVIDATGKVAYQGAIDDDPRGDKGEGAVNHVAQALDELLAGRPATVPETAPYGCSVKYAK